MCYISDKDIKAAAEAVVTLDHFLAKVGKLLKETQSLPFNDEQTAWLKKHWGVKDSDLQRFANREKDYDLDPAARRIVKQFSIPPEAVREWLDESRRRQ